MPRQSVQNLADRSTQQVQLKEKTPVKVGEMGLCCPMFSRNLKSAVQYPQVVADKIAKEVALGRRLIHHLSFPRGSSVNDGIAKDEVSVSYVSFDRAVALLREAGEGAYMAKSDVESAFRLLPVHPDCYYHLLGCHFGDAFYYDTCLPMGCSISCFYFELFSTFLEWAACYEAGSRAIIHYLDDFLFVAQDSSRCSYLLNSFCSLMQRFGVPLSSEKTVGPARCLTFLGIELDSVQMVFCLPPDKISKLLGLVKGFLAVSKVTLKQMQSLLGMLVFACRVMPMGRVFSRRLSLATRGVSRPEHRIRITRAMKEDLEIWRVFLESYNGRTCWQAEEVSNKELALFMDAAGSTGFGAILGKEWCAARWPPEWLQGELCRNLAFLELFPIVVAIELWGFELSNKRAYTRCSKPMR
ncbi:uncharacterized protein ACNLHF_023941 [Anomaloglossus baeobatrachus]